MCTSRVRGSLSWSDLPTDILSVISDLLKSKYSNLSILNFRAVCKSWRSSVPPPFLRLHTLLPCTLSCIRRSDYPRLPVNYIHHDTPLVVVTTAVYILRQRHSKYSNSTNPWLVAVEQSNTLEPHKLRLCHPLTRLPIEGNVPCKNIIMSDFDAIKLSQGINLRSMDATPLKYDYDDVYHVDKVILWSDPLHKSRKFKHYYVVVLYGKGKLACFRLDGCRDHKGISIPIDGYADDIVTWKEKLWAVSRKGKLYGIDYNSMKVKYAVTVASNLEGNRRKRLFVDSNYDLYLLLAYQNCQQFKVFKLDRRHEWEKVVTLGDNILFVTFDSCFFASSQHFSGVIQGNCIVYPKNCFPTYSGSCKSDDVLFPSASSGYLQVAMCKYEETNNSALISTFPRFSAVFWPPPLWISKPGPSSQVSASSEEHVSSAPRLEGQSTGIPSTSVAQAKTTSHHLLDSDKNHEEALNTISDDKVSGTDHASVTPVMASTELCEPSINFLQGLKIRSDLLVTLQIWNKHCNLVGKGFVRSKGILACALELLAKMIKDLENTTLRTLTDDLAEEIGAVMSDLQLLGLKVDWLVPFVERALILQKYKPLIESIIAIDEEKARVEEEEEFLERNPRKKRKLEENRASLSATLRVLEPIDLDESLAEGLF
ncbi:hypothetical protein BVRB_4g090440 [Beta vulgaris subsp. vulgaris]|nr:hypothetical protein BVRB_4g090440 [Beta vulgaris subsp. vulgaris]